MALTTDRVKTSRTLLAGAVSERTAQRSHRGLRPASHTGRPAHYDLPSGPVTAKPSGGSGRPGATPAIRYGHDHSGGQGTSFPVPAPSGRTPPAAEPVGPRLGEAARVARIRGAGHHELGLRRHAGPERRLGEQGRGPGPRRGHRRGDRPARVGRPGERLRGRASRRRGDHPARHRGGPRGRIGGGLHRFRGGPHLRPAGCGRTGRRGGAGRARGPGPLRAHRPRRELPARAARPRGHDRQAAGLPGGWRGRPLRSRAAATSQTSAG